jgi:Phage capsid family
MGRPPLDGKRAMTSMERQRRYWERQLSGGDDTPLVRAVLATGLAKLESKLPGEIVRRNWGNDRDVDLVLRAAQTPTSIANTSALSQITVAFLDALVPLSAAVDLFSRGIGLNFAGAAQITVPGISIPTGGFVGEGQPIPVRQAQTSAGPTLTPHKLATICSLTGELMRNPNAEALVRQVLVESTGPTLDQVVFSTNAATASQPAGLLNGITPLTPAAVGQAKSEILVDDLQKIAIALGPVAGNSNIVLVGSSDASAALKMRLPEGAEWPVLTSNSLAAKTVIGVATAAIVSAVEGVPQIEASKEAEIHYDTVPGEIVDIGGVLAAPVASLYQTDRVGLKLRWPISWALRDVRGIAWMQNVNW